MSTGVFPEYNPSRIMALMLSSMVPAASMPEGRVSLDIGLSLILAFALSSHATEASAPEVNVAPATVENVVNVQAAVKVDDRMSHVTTRVLKLFESRSDKMAKSLADAELSRGLARRARTQKELDEAKAKLEKLKAGGLP
jgi:Skp family chaperone for outer membrane proteins